MSAIEHEYKVLMTHSPVAESNGGARWRATLLGFPFIAEEAFSREQAIHQIEQRMVEILAHTEIITLRTPTFPERVNDADEELTAHGWGDHGLFRDDSAALHLFDEIESERDNIL